MVRIKGQPKTINIAVQNTANVACSCSKQEKNELNKRRRYPLRTRTQVKTYHEHTSAINDVENQQEQRIENSKRPKMNEDIFFSVQPVQKKMCTNSQTMYRITENTASDVECQDDDYVPSIGDITENSSRTSESFSEDSSMENEISANDQKTCCTNNLIVAPPRYPREMFNDSMISKIKKAILELISLLSHPDKPLIFNGTMNVEGAIIFQCANEPTVKWLKELNQLWIDNRVTFIQVEKIGRPSNCYHIMVHVKEDLDRKIILEYLSKQNKGLATHEWAIIEDSEYRDENGSHFDAFVRADSLNILKALDFKPYCGLERAVIDCCRSQMLN